MPRYTMRKRYLPRALEVSGVGLDKLVGGDVLHRPRRRRHVRSTQGASACNGAAAPNQFLSLTIRGGRASRARVLIPLPCVKYRPYPSFLGRTSRKVEVGPHFEGPFGPTLLPEMSLCSNILFGKSHKKYQILHAVIYLP